MKTRFLMVFIVGLLVAGTAIAQSSPKSSVRVARAEVPQTKFDRHFSNTDRNGDGYICREEAAEYSMLKRDFHLIDINRDGKLSKAEMLAPRRTAIGKNKDMVQARYSTSDTAGAVIYDKNQVEAAMLAKIARNFDLMDVNKDGRVSLAELQAARQVPHASANDHDQTEDWFRSADLNQDGQLTRQEAEAAGRAQLAEKFELQDTNGDGLLTREELRLSQHPYLRRAT